MFRIPNFIARHLPALALATATLAAAPAFAHAHPKTSDPAPDSTVAAPKAITITFTEAVEPKFSSISVTNAAGATVSKQAAQPVSGDAATLTLPVPTLATGTYTVHWVSVATDGHRMQGTYKFNVK